MVSWMYMQMCFIEQSSPSVLLGPRPEVDTDGLLQVRAVGSPLRPHGSRSLVTRPDVTRAAVCEWGARLGEPMILPRLPRWARSQLVSVIVLAQG